MPQAVWPDLLHKEPLPLWKTTVDPYLCGGTQTQFWLSLSEVVGFWCAQCFVWALQGSPVGMQFDSKCDFTPPPPFCDFSLPLDMGYHFSVGSNILLSMVVQQWVVILEFLQKISTHPELHHLRLIPFLGWWSFLPELVTYTQGFAFCISRMSPEIFCFLQETLTYLLSRGKWVFMIFDRKISLWVLKILIFYLNVTRLLHSYRW